MSKAELYLTEDVDDIVDMVFEFIANSNTKQMFEKDTDGMGKSEIDDDFINEYIREIIAGLPIEVAVNEETEMFDDYGGYGDKFRQWTKESIEYYQIYEYIYEVSRDDSTRDGIEKYIKEYLGV